jgi:hypothetical protein
LSGNACITYTYDVARDLLIISIEKVQHTRSTGSREATTLFQLSRQ